MGERVEPDERPQVVQQIKAHIALHQVHGDRATYDAAYTHWDGTPARDHYRVAWRRMAANTGERTLIPALIPQAPGM